MKSFVADPGCCAVEGVGVRTLACWNCVFESCRKHRCPSFANVVYLQVEVTVTVQSLGQRSPTEWCVCVCVCRVLTDATMYLYTSVSTCREIRIGYKN